MGKVVRQSFWGGLCFFTQTTMGLFMASGSLLEKVAQHEISLMSELESAETQAQKIIDTAHAAASNHLTGVQTRMDTEIVEMRRKAVQERISIREDIEQTSRRQVQEIRDKSAGRLDSVKAELLNMVLPRKGGAA